MLVFVNVKYLLLVFVNVVIGPKVQSLQPQETPFHHTTKVKSLQPHVTPFTIQLKSNDYNLR